MEVKDENYFKAAFTKMHKYLQDDLFYDVTLRCGTTIIKGHKLVLSSLSDYFKNMFLYKTKEEQDESEEYSLDKNIIKPHVIEFMVNFAYTGRILIDDSNVQDLLIAANFLQVDFVSLECERFMVKKIDKENVISLIKFGCRFNLSVLLDAICMFASNHFHELFLELSLTEFESIIDNYNFTVMKNNIPVYDPEISILKLVGEYFNHKTLEKQDQFDNSDVNTLLNTIRFHDILDLDDLKEFVEKHSVINVPDISILLMNRPKTMSNVRKSDLKYRKYSNNFKTFIKGRQFSDRCTGAYNAGKSTSGSHSTSINDRPKKVKLFFVGSGFNHHSTLVRISILYKSGEIVTHGPECYNSDVEHEFDLEDDEVITKVFVKYRSFIFTLKFFTNYGRMLGPFGDVYSSFPWRSESCSSTSYLHSCVSIHGRNNETDYIEGLKFSWLTYCTEQNCRTCSEGFDRNDDKY
ncbi:unnamed protein product [Mytilus edulis]|uniref:BTB domain-containing protein n=1 Tax=Mytilus edulis TaxID=6550 RepID=A0A8S3VH64_MYTED|nr:unnamed protein product [Mytilus edulis]